MNVLPRPFSDVHDLNLFQFIISSSGFFGAVGTKTKTLVFLKFYILACSKLALWYIVSALAQG